jgi:hypothetical protein
MTKGKKDEGLTQRLGGAKKVGSQKNVRIKNGEGENAASGAIKKGFL